jgi:hypothetical protein
MPHERDNMNGEAFDRLSKRMGAATSRRGLLPVFVAGIGAAAAGSLLGSDLLLWWHRMHLRFLLLSEGHRLPRGRRSWRGLLPVWGGVPWRRRLLPVR